MFFYSHFGLLFNTNANFWLFLYKLVFFVRISTSFFCFTSCSFSRTIAVSPGEMNAKSLIASPGLHELNPTVEKYIIRLTITTESGQSG